MPIYEYQCEECGHVSEALQRISDAPLTVCGHCHGKLHKLISQSSFHLKGTGWYVTDYANKSKTSSASGSQKGKKEASGAEKKTENSNSGSKASTKAASND